MAQMMAHANFAYFSYPFIQESIEAGALTVDQVLGLPEAYLKEYQKSSVQTEEPPTHLHVLYQYLVKINGPVTIEACQSEYKKYNRYLNVQYQDEDYGEAKAQKGIRELLKGQDTPYEFCLISELYGFKFEATLEKDEKPKKNHIYFEKASYAHAKAKAPKNNLNYTFLNPNNLKEKISGTIAGFFGQDEKLNLKSLKNVKNLKTLAGKILVPHSKLANHLGGLSLNLDNAVIGKLYLVKTSRGQGFYIVRDFHGNVHQGRLPNSIDMTGFESKLDNSRFKQSILKVTLENGHTEGIRKIEENGKSRKFHLKEDCLELYQKASVSATLEIELAILQALREYPGVVATEEAAKKQTIKPSEHQKERAASPVVVSFSASSSSSSSSSMEALKLLHPKLLDLKIITYSEKQQQMPSDSGRLYKGRDLYDGLECGNQPITNVLLSTEKNPFLEEKEPEEKEPEEKEREERESFLRPVPESASVLRLNRARHQSVFRLFGRQPESEAEPEAEKLEKFEKLEESDALEREPKGRRLTSDDLKAFSSWTKSRQDKEAMALQALTGNNQRFYLQQPFDIKEGVSELTKPFSGLLTLFQDSKKRTYTQFSEKNATSHSPMPALKLGDF